MLSKFLRESMSSRHSKIEQHPLQNDLANGTISKEKYAKYLQGLLSYHRGFESALKKHINDAPLKGIVEHDYFMIDRLEKDLSELGFSSDSGNNGNTSSGEKSVENPLELLGILYVILGSKHGGKYMSKMLSDKMGSEYHHHYLDPFGTKLGALWSKFVADIDALPLSDEERNTVLKGAISAYDAFTHSSDLAIAK